MGYKQSNFFILIFKKKWVWILVIINNNKNFSQTKIRNTGLFSQTNLKTYLGEQNFNEDCNGN
jgi:hypothetical protein